MKHTGFVFTTLLGWILLLGIALCIAAIALDDAEASPKLASIALKYDGLHEQKNYSQVKRLVGHNPKAQPWCSTFLCAVVKQGGYRCPKGYYSARSFTKWGKPVSIKNIRKGDIVVFSRGKGKGHNGVFLHWSKGKMVIVSGNSRNQVRVGHYSTNRLIAVRRAG